MTADEIAVFFARWSVLGDEVRESWLAEINPALIYTEWEDVRLLLANLDQDVVDRLIEGARWHAQAPKRNARKQRKKSEWQRELARHLQRAGPRTRVAKYYEIPNEHEHPLSLCEGRFEIHRRVGQSGGRDKRVGPLICCEFDDRKKREEISFSTFERYLKAKTGAE